MYLGAAGVLVLPSASTSVLGDPGPVAGCPFSKMSLSSLSEVLSWSYSEELGEPGLKFDFMVSR